MTDITLYWVPKFSKHEVQRVTRWKMYLIEYDLGMLDFTV